MAKCASSFNAEKCILDDKHKGATHLGDDGTEWPMHLPWNPATGYTIEPR